ncbi:P-type conjugative transfer protein TrbL [Pseudomonas aeruginosa]|uniref:P-type conjugative transfer protein TrbL n=1 Tax=Pseudomonas aeruginosa TaxID=287 RepID=UPI00383AF9CC
MNDVGIIDRFLDTYSRYIDSGFGLIGGEVSFLTATLIAIDMTLAGLFWAMNNAVGQGEDVLAKLIRKVLYVGAFAYILNNFNLLAGILFRSFAGLGLKASGSQISTADFLRPGRLASTGINAASPILDQVKDLAGFPEVFVNFVPIVVLLLAWVVVIVSFFILAVQLFVTLIEFKLTCLAGFVLVPFALWNKTSFLAEKVLGNVVSSGIKILVLGVIVGIGTSLFDEFKFPENAAITQALVIMLASLSMLALGMYGPGIATGLISGAPQLGAGAAAGTALTTAAMVAGAAALATGAGVAVGAAARIGAGGRVASGAAGATGGSAGGPGNGGGSGGAGGGGMSPASSGSSAGSSGTATVADKSGSQTPARPTSGAQESTSSREDSAGKAAVGQAQDARVDSKGGTNPSPDRAASDEPQNASPPAEQPAWAKRMQRKQQITHAATTLAHALRSGDGGGAGSGPSLRDTDS